MNTQHDRTQQNKVSLITSTPSLIICSLWRKTFKSFDKQKIYFFFLICLAQIFSLNCFVTSAHADEGMWEFSKFPDQILKEKYNFQPTNEWKEHLMKSSVRLSFSGSRGGGSGSFVSADGLVLTNHHVASRLIDDLSKADKRDYFSQGFLARSLADERPSSVGMEVENLVLIEDVTQKVLSAVPANATSEKANMARKAIIADISREAESRLGLKCEVVSLHQGGEYHLYAYKVYTDLRLVFAPEHSAAAFGGDPDNFEYPRFGFDMAVIRVYENGKPAVIHHFLKPPTSHLNENDLIFVSGNPGRTDRLLTLSSLAWIRDISLPYDLASLRRKEVLLNNYMQRGPDQRKSVEDELLSIQNSRKLLVKRALGLQDPQIWQELKKREDAFKADIENDDALKPMLADFKSIEQTDKYFSEIFLDYKMFESGDAFDTPLFSYARGIIRSSAEKQKPDHLRLEEFNEAKLKAFERGLLAPRVLSTEVETLKLTSSLSVLLEKYNYTYSLYNQVSPNSITRRLAQARELIRKIMNEKGPEARAKELIKNSRLIDAKERERLYKLASQDLANEQDPMLVLARDIDQFSRQIREIYESRVREVRLASYERLARARFKLYADSIYPDATFTPRVSFGRVLGLPGISAFTTLAGGFEREISQGRVAPFAWPETWKKAQADHVLELSTPFNFISTADIIGGNSGSPVVNRQGELVGLIFDGNMDSLISSYYYDESNNRAVSVDMRAIFEVLQKVYKADWVLQSWKENKN